MNRRSFFGLAIGGAVAAPVSLLVGEAVSGARLVPKDEIREWGKMAQVITIEVSGTMTAEQARKIRFNNSQALRR
ncbi:hypothetical protein HFO41_25025 [Rhizobium leguminosarum]|uniref:hypothetical protein n=1 Tax=Rhizobium leguminosarum TaxID=384 RepID=UPI001C9776F5|nr:hypothetical protein [Rhizobium leguminosarum]MBY5692049.1 hypothetical protein [Rhizobium leguminosarum]